jgi:hypothetical protein
MKAGVTNVRLVPGITALEALRIVVQRHREVEAIQVVSYPRAPLVQDREELRFGDREIVRRALVSREKSHLPFWDSVMMQIYSAEPSEGYLLDAALFHQSQRGAEMTLTREEVLEGAVEKLSRNVAPDHGLALSSELRNTDGARLHLPLLDFHVPINERSEILAVAVARRILGAGFVLLQGHNSYHLWGLKLMSQADLINFLARALLFAPIVDRAYVAHQLLERRCALRISAAPPKAIPYVVFVEPIADAC